MDRRRFIGTVGVASAAVAASSVLAEDLAHAEPLSGPAAPPPEHVDNRFLDALTKVNDLQVPATLSSYQGQIDTLASPRALAQSALRLLSALRQPPRSRTITAPRSSARWMPCWMRSSTGRTRAVSTTSATWTARRTPRS